MSSDGKKGLIDRVAGIVLAGGQGTRLYPLTQTRCKPAVGFGGRYRLIDIPLSNALNAKISKLYVITQHLSLNLHQHITATYQLDGGIELLTPKEEMLFQGTADAVRKSLHHLLKSPADYFIILSGDQLYNIDLHDFVHFAEQKKAKMVVAAIEVKESEAKRMGLMKIDRDFHITDFVEKPKEKTVLNRFVKDSRYLASMGIYVFRRDALIELLSEAGDDFGHHLIPAQIAKEGSYAYVYEGYWVDIGTVGSYYEANMNLLSQKNCLQTYNEEQPIYTRPHNLPSPLIIDTQVHRSFISQGSIIEASKIEQSILGMRCRVGRGTKIKNSILMGNQFYSPPPHQPLPKSFTVGENCIIEKAIIDEHTRLGNNVRLVNEQKLGSYDGPGICIRDGIIIVQSGTDLPDGFVL